MNHNLNNTLNNNTNNNTNNDSTMSAAQEAAFGLSLKHALNEAAQSVPEAAADRLRVARRAALNRRQEVFGNQAKVNGFSKWMQSLFGSLGSPMALAFPALVVGFGLYSLSASNADNYMQTVAEIETQVLTQEVPLDALLDKGFVRYVQVGE